jgi:hypothetical protein
MTDAWLSHIDRPPARRPGEQDAKFAAVPNEPTRGERLAQWAATALTIGCAVIGVLIVSLTAVVLGLA